MIHTQEQQHLESYLPPEDDCHHCGSHFGRGQDEEEVPVDFSHREVRDEEETEVVQTVGGGGEEKGGEKESGEQDGLVRQGL